MPSTGSADWTAWQRGLIPWKPGQSGNAKGRPRGSRNKLSEEFFRDLCDAWQAFGKPALMSAAWTNPTDFVRVVAQLMPKDVELTATNIADGKQRAVPDH
jgi:hypothetical protein